MIERRLSGYDNTEWWQGILGLLVVSGTFLVVQNLLGDAGATSTLLISTDFTLRSRYVRGRRRQALVRGGLAVVSIVVATGLTAAGPTPFAHV